MCNEHDMGVPLHFSILANSVENTKILLKHNANPNYKDEQGRTPMHYAVLSKNLGLVRLLDDYNGDALIKNDDGINAIDLAIDNNFREMKLHFLG